MRPHADDPMPPAAERLLGRIARREATVGVVGLGYVGLPLVAAFVGAGFLVLGYDADDTKIARLLRGEAYIAHLGTDLPARLLASGRFDATHDPARLAEPDAVLLCVPTPLGRHHEPDLSAVRSCSRLVARSARAGQLIVLESTTYPGTTREIVTGELGAGAPGLAIGRDLFVAYSPEREDPGSRGHSVRDVPKVVGGIDGATGPSVRLASALYAAVAPSIVAVASCEIAESSKLVENIYRAVNIALVNELKVIFEGMGIDVWEVLEAAATKPFGFHRFNPGPGLGGHCIPIDPYYLEWKARETGGTARFIELAGEINRAMPRRVVRRIAEALNDGGLPLRGARVLVLGVAYKKNIDDIRETPAAEIIDRLAEAGSVVTYHDPHIPVFPPMRRHAIDLRSVPLDAGTLGAADAVVIVTDHDGVDYALVGRHARLVIDTRNAMAAVPDPAARVVKA